MVLIRLAGAVRAWGIGLLLLPAIASAELRLVPEGTAPELQEGEAFLVLAVDSDAPLASARVRRADEFTDFGAIRAGQHYALYIADAGRYAWRDVAAVGGDTLPLDLENFSFDLEAGDLNYAGDLVYRSRIEGAEGVVAANRGLRAMDWMSRAFPRIKKKHVFRYAGNVPDAFPAYAAKLPAPHGDTAPAPQARELPLDIAALWQPTRVQIARMNPSGTRVAIKRQGLASGQWAVELVDLRSGESTTMQNAADAVAAMEWSSDDTLLTTGDDGHRIVHEVQAASRAAANSFGAGTESIRGGAGASYGVTDEGRAQRELVELDAAGQATRTLYAKPGVDIEAPIFDSQLRPIGVTYYDRGRLASEYFAPADRELDAKVRARFPTQSVAVLDRSKDGSGLLLSVEGADMPPALYHFDAQDGARLLAEGVQELAQADFAPTRTLTVRSKDGLAIEAFLTLPEGPGRKPLVVMPHGGPIAVADRLHFNREVQFLASLGYGVLRVNFRGSEGYGRAFREAGHGNYGTGIEDDIDAAIEQVGEQVAEIDTGRMCMLGASYGGYSALVSAARWPQRFRCAVSISGIGDLSLMFSASDAGRSHEGRALLRQLIGDPVADAAALRAVSPVYRADAIEAPVMLVHGLEDARVDFEHAARMQRALAAHGNAPVMMRFDGEGHSIDEPRNVEAMWRGIAGFLQQHLGTPRLLAAN